MDPDQQEDRHSPEGQAESWLGAILGGGPAPKQADSPEAAAKVILDRHGTAGRRFLDLAFDPAAAREDLYAAKNATLDLSLDASLLWSGDLYRAQLPQLADLLRTRRPQRVIDLGCDQGLLTCFVGGIADWAEVVGLDPCCEAIARAGDLRDRVGLANVSFAEADPIHAEPGIEPADLVITSRVILGEAIPPGDDRPAELLAGSSPADAEWKALADRAASRIASLLNPEAMIVALERTGTSGLVRWANALARAGLCVATPVTRVTVDEPGNPGQTFRLIEAVRQPAGADRRLPPASDLLGGQAIPTGGQPLEGEAAERAALSVGPPVGAEAWEWVNSAGDTEHLELADSAEGLIELRCSTNGSRTLTTHPDSAAESLRERVQRELVANSEAGIVGAEPLLGPHCT